jgi:GMP synthase (glutamine-hydrolysing)
MAPASLRVLLLQARNPGDPIREQEVRCFATRTGLPVERIVPHDLLEGPPSLASVRSHDALMVGGSGDFYISKRDLPELERTLDLLREVAVVGHPTFASCYGYHCLVDALGGRIVHDPDQKEVGTFPLELTDAGRTDPLFGTLPDRFQAQLGHRDRASVHPDGIPNLAASERSPLQALRVPGQPVWATQFHPELDRESSGERLRVYLASYAPDLADADRARLEAQFGDSPETSELLRRFLALVFT